MVAIALYKGNLHKVSDVPRKWIMPQRKISLTDFRILLRRRNRALSRHFSAATATATTTTTVTTTVTDNPNPNSDSVNRDAEPEIPQLKEEEEAEEKAPVAKADMDEDAVEGTGEERGPKGGDGLGRVEAEVADSVPNEIKHEVDENGVNNVMEDHQVKMEENTNREVPMNPNIEIQENNKEDAESNKDKRKKEVEEKLHILKEKKHGLVQVLKQILNAEEELKRRSSMQGMAGRSSLPLHVDIPNDTGSMTRLNTPRMGSDGILIGDVEGGEPDGMSNQNADSQHLLRLSSQSPSSDSQHRKPANNMPHSARTTLGVIGSPSRFAPTPTAQQGHPSNLPTVSVSGTNYIASSPSPAASGGTSVFRESQIPSPWN